LFCRTSRPYIDYEQFKVFTGLLETKVILISVVLLLKQPPEEVLIEDDLQNFLFNQQCPVKTPDKEANKKAFRAIRKTQILFISPFAL
jgi:hypothetical protein